MNRKTKRMAGSALGIAMIAGGTGVAVASGGDADTPLTGSNLDRAVAAALEAAGGGTVVETEAGDGGAAYGVEIRLDDGSHVEVSLDESFNVIGREADDDGANDRDGSSDR